MDLEARVTALEDEVGILKGEIKAVLLEVRTAFLAQSNPFVKPSLTLTAAPAAPVTVVPEPAPEPEVIPEPAPLVMEPVVMEKQRMVVPAPRQTNAPRFDINTLAMLMAWTQGNMARLNLSEMSSLLALARYGEVIEAELERILMKIAEHFEDDEDERLGIARRKQNATISEYLLALHELHTVIHQDDTGFRWLREIA